MLIVCHPKRSCYLASKMCSVIVIIKGTYCVLSKIDIVCYHPQTVIVHTIYNISYWQYIHPKSSLSCGKFHLQQQ